MYFFFIQIHSRVQEKIINMNKLHFQRDNPGLKFHPDSKIPGIFYSVFSVQSNEKTNKGHIWGQLLISKLSKNVQESSDCLFWQTSYPKMLELNGK